VEEPEPSGWIYFGAAPEPGRYLQRIDVASGTVEDIPYTAVFPAGQTFLTVPGMVSPVDGRIAAQGIVVGHSWPQTFIYDPRSGEVDLYGDPAVTRDFGHVWSPDGRHVVFERHLATGGDGRPRLVCIDVVSGRTDTLYVGARQESIEGIRWLGVDTLVLDYFAIPQGSEFLALDLNTRHTRLFEEAEHWGGGPLLAFSSSGHWISRWTLTLIDAPASNPDSTILSVRDRTTSDDWRRIRAIGFYDTEGSIAVAFAPDEEFMADCPTNDTVRILRLADLVEVRRWHVPVCFALSWSRE
jgi:hypothetical protein